MSLSGPVVPPASGDARQLVVLLHGWGADGNDLIGLAPALQPALPKARFASPNAPETCDQNPMGRQWYSFMDDRPEVLKAGYERAAGLINAYLEQAANRQLALNLFQWAAARDKQLDIDVPKAPDSSLRMSGFALTAIAGGIVIGLPLLLVAFGVTRWALRRRR